MEPSKTHNSQAAPARPPSKLSIMERASPTQETPKASKDPVENTENVQGNGHRMRTPPTSTAEVFSPASSSKRGRLRAASLAGSPSAGRGLGNPSMGFGAGLQKVPSPITTTATLRQTRPLEPTQANEIREPLPGTQLPGITETLKDFAPSPANKPPVTIAEGSAPVANDVSTISHPEKDQSNGHSLENNPDVGDPAKILNIYLRRADQIGPSHLIPGIGHLGDLLVPPGWNQGDDPINEAEARRVFAVSRAQAQEMLDQSIKENSHLPNADQQKLAAEKNTQYQTQRALDEYLLLERIKIYQFTCSRKQKPPQQKHPQAQQHRQFETKAGTRPRPLQPPVETSMIAYQRHQQALVPASPHRYAPSPPLSGGALNARINTMVQGLHIPQASPMSPTFLDPGLVPQTLESVYDCYARNQVIIMNMNNENERFLTQWSAKFNVVRPQGPMAPGVIPCMTGQRAAPFGSVHYGYMPQEPRPWTPSQARLGGIPDSAAQAQQGRHNLPTSNRSNPRQGNGRALPYPVNRNGPFRYPGEEKSSPQRKSLAIRTPESKKRNHTPKPDKNKPWYADEVAKADLPTSVISQAAMKAGMEFKPNEDLRQTPPKPKGRRGMPVIDPRKGFVVSAHAAKALIANGAADARPSSQTEVLDTTMNKPTAIDNPPVGVITDHQAALHPGAGAQVTSVPTVHGEEDTISAPNSAVSGPSSDTPDDPKDTNYSQRAPRKPATNQTTAATRKTASTASKKRKSTEVAPHLKKRTRHSADDVADVE